MHIISSRKSWKERKARYMTLPMWSNFDIGKIWPIVRQPEETFCLNLDHSRTIEWDMQRITCFSHEEEICGIFFDFSAGLLTFRFCVFSSVRSYFGARVASHREWVVPQGLRMAMTSSTELGRSRIESAANYQNCFKCFFVPKWRCSILEGSVTFLAIYRTEQCVCPLDACGHALLLKMCLCR